MRCIEVQYPPAMVTQSWSWCGWKVTSSLVSRIAQRAWYSVTVRLQAQAQSQYPETSHNPCSHPGDSNNPIVKTIPNVLATSGCIFILLSVCWHPLRRLWIMQSSDTLALPHWQSLSTRWPLALPHALPHHSLSTRFSIHCPLALFLGHSLYL